MAAENFTDRMRERMPAHQVWRDVRVTPGMSRPAQDAMWEEMRERLRAFERQRRVVERRNRLAALSDLVRGSDGRSVAVILVAAGLLAMAVFELFR